MNFQNELSLEVGSSPGISQGILVCLFKSSTIPFGVPSPKYCLFLFSTIPFGVPSLKYCLSLITTIPFEVSYPEFRYLCFIITLRKKSINLVFPNEMSILVIAPSLFLKNEQRGATVDTSFCQEYFKSIFEPCSFFSFWIKPRTPFRLCLICIHGIFYLYSILIFNFIWVFYFDFAFLGHQSLLAIHSF